MIVIILVIIASVIGLLSLLSEAFDFIEGKEAENENYDT